MRKIKIIGLTGQSGAGKSTASEFFKKRGCAVINADLLVREIYSENSACLKCLAACFGDDILAEDGSIIRPVLAKKAFSSQNRTELLNSVVHPFVTALMLKKTGEARDKGYSHVIYDAPQLFESGADVVCDEIIGVTADRQTRLDRILARDGISEAAVSERINAQLDESFFKNNCGFVVRNNGSKAELEAELEKILDLICNRGD